MRIEEAKKKVEEAGGSWDTFNDWMRGQTAGINDDGTIDLYDYDVNRFIRYKCDPKNEPMGAWD